MTKIAKIFWISLLLKLALVAALPLTNDEAYYWVWSRHMQLSYYDHPPFVAWLFWLGDFLRELSGVGGTARWPGVILGHASLGIWLLLLRPFLTDGQRLMWLCLALLSPLVGGSALLVTPDLPLMFFYASSLALFLNLSTKYDWRKALALGLCLGLGLSSKYMIVLFGLSLLPVVATDRNLRAVFLRALPLILIGSAAGALPVWLWNFLNDFASFKFQAHHGLGQRAWKPSWTYEYVLVQIALIFPVILYWALRARRRVPVIFQWMAWTPLAFFFLTTSRGYVEGNWPIVAYPALFVLAVSFFPENSRSLKLTLLLWGSVIIGLAALIFAQPEWSKGFKTREFHQFDELVGVVNDLSPVFARSYQMAAKLSFDLRKPLYKLKGMNRTDFYDFRRESEPPEHGLYYVIAEKEDRLPQPYEARGDQIVERRPIGERFEVWQVRAR